MVLIVATEHPRESAALAMVMDSGRELVSCAGAFREVVILTPRSSLSLLVVLNNLGMPNRA